MMPRFRITLRTLLAVIAVMAVTLGGVLECRRLARLSVAYRAKADDHAGIEKTLRMIIDQTGPNSPIDISPVEGIRSRRFTAKSVAEFQAELSRKYQRAARYPWLTVTPDLREPPGPE